MTFIEGFMLFVDSIPWIVGFLFAIFLFGMSIVIGFGAILMLWDKCKKRDKP